MSSPKEYLTEAGQHLARAEALIGPAGVELGEPFHEPLRLLAMDVEAIRRRLRNATTTSTARRSDA